MLGIMRNFSRILPYLDFSRLIILTSFYFEWMWTLRLPHYRIIQKIAKSIRLDEWTSAKPKKKFLKQIFRFFIPLHHSFEIKTRLSKLKKSDLRTRTFSCLVQPWKLSDVGEFKFCTRNENWFWKIFFGLGHLSSFAILT